MVVEFFYLIEMFIGLVFLLFGFVFIVEFLRDVCVFLVVEFFNLIEMFVGVVILLLVFCVF